MRILKPPKKSDILALRCRKFLNSSFTSPPGYFLLVINSYGHRVEVSETGHDVVKRSDLLYLLKKNFEITWGTENNLPYFSDGRILPDKLLGVNGTASFEVSAPVDLFRRLEMYNFRKISINRFKNIWRPHWNNLLREAIMEKGVNYIDVPLLIPTLKHTIYGVKTLQINYKGSNQ